MALKKPFGVTIFAGIFTVIGGFLAVIVIFELIDSIRFFGPSSVGISSPMSLMGFLIFAGIPTLLYAAGIGLFLSQPWARTAVIYILPGLFFIYFFNLAYTIAAQRTLILAPSAVEIVFENTDVFMNVFVRYLFLIVPVVYYFTRPVVSLYFDQFLAISSKDPR